MKHVTVAPAHEVAKDRLEALKDRGASPAMSRGKVAVLSIPGCNEPGMDRKD